MTDTISLLEKLKIKNTPELYKDINFALPKKQEDIFLQTKITDKTNENLINKDEFMNKIKNKLVFEEIYSKPEEKFLKSEEIVKVNITNPNFKIIKKLNKTIVLTEKEETSKRITQKPTQKIVNISKTDISKTDIDLSGLPKKNEDINLKASPFYLNNREKFVDFITNIFSKYESELSENETSCSNKDDLKFSLMGHQKIIKDYISKYTPYRGLLLYHGLGSGKTCSSIAIAEGLKTDKKVIVLTPASLRMNYVEELKKCGDDIYKKNQYWEFIPSNNIETINELANILSLPSSVIFTITFSISQGDKN